jgi:hypothetical protein
MIPFNILFSAHALVVKSYYLIIVNSYESIIATSEANCCLVGLNDNINHIKATLSERSLKFVSSFSIVPDAKSKLRHLGYDSFVK